MLSDDSVYRRIRFGAGGPLKTEGGYYRGKFGCKQKARRVPGLFEVRTKE
jgi:hypothetical protein